MNNVRSVGACGTAAMRATASIIIPCYNAEHWIAESVQSALSQTWKDCEVIVVDDGSTDNSATVLQHFDSAIRRIVQKHKGGNAARNCGLAVSTGQYIQFLDADDLLLPEKVTRQVAAFEGGADVIYEDWRPAKQTTGLSFRAQRVVESGFHADMIEALLGLWPMPPPCAFLYDRRIIDKVGGWDENLTSAQDWDLNLRIALAGGVFRYIPGCNSIYRRPSTVTVSTAPSPELHRNINHVLRNAENALAESGRLSRRYRTSIASSYFMLARAYRWNSAPFASFYAEANRLSPDFIRSQSCAYRTLFRLFGVETAEKIAYVKRKLIRRRVSERL